MTELSPAAQAVLDAANAAYDDAATVAQGIAAALRALATRGERVMIVRTPPVPCEFDNVIRTSDILAIAAELDPKSPTP